MSHFTLKLVKNYKQYTCGKVSKILYEFYKSRHSNFKKIRNKTDSEKTFNLHLITLNFQPLVSENSENAK